MGLTQQRFAVIGSNSFSGSHFVALLMDKGAEVLGISRSPEPAEVFLAYKWNRHDHLHFCQFDLNHDLDVIVKEVNAFRPEYIVNFAAQGMVAESWQNPEHWFRTNTLSHILLHERLRTCTFLKKYVHISTPEVYGSCCGLVREGTPYNPSTPYAASKAAADMSLMTFFRNYRFPVVLTRSANVYGSGQQLYRIIPRTILYFLTGRTLQLHGGGYSVRSFVHVKDVAEGTWLAATRAHAGEIYHFATEEMISIRELVERIAGKLGVDFKRYVVVVGDRPGKDAAYSLDTAKARRELGWTDTVSLDRGIDETIDWVRTNLSKLSALPGDYIHKP